MTILDALQHLDPWDFVFRGGKGAQHGRSSSGTQAMPPLNQEFIPVADQTSGLDGLLLLAQFKCFNLESRSFADASFISRRRHDDMMMS